MRRLASIAFAISLTGCSRGEELARIDLGTDVMKPLEGWGPFAREPSTIWIAYDAQWKGGKELPGGTLELELLRGETSLTKVSCDTDNRRVRICPGESSRDCEVDIQCAIDAGSEPGELTLRATLTFDEPALFSSVTKMALVQRR